MKLLLTILACLVAASAGAQTIKSLGYNTTNGKVVYSGTNTLAFTNLSGVVLQNGPLAVSEIQDNSGNSIFMVNDQYFVNVSANGGAALDWGGSSVIVGLPISFAASSNAATTRTNLGLGATNNVTFSNVTASGTLAVTGNVTLSGVNNTMPGATNAASASSLMTRDLVGQEFANPRRKLQTTYWFGIEGLGEWSTIGTSAASAYVSGGGNGFGGGRAFYSTTRVGLNHAGGGLRLGADNNYGGSPYRVSDGGPLTMRANIRKQSVVERQAIAFLMGIRTATQLWQQNSYGLYFVPQPTNVWTSNGVVTQHSRIAVSNVVWSVNTAGTNDTTEPAWTDLIGSLVTNGSAVYRNLGPHTSNNWVLAIGSTNASQVVMTNTGKEGPQNINRAEVVLKLRSDGTTNTPYTIYGSVENAAGESSEVSLTTTNTDQRQPQFWSRFDEESGTTNVPADPMIRYFSIDAVIPSLF